MTTSGAAVGYYTRQLQRQSDAEHLVVACIRCTVQHYSTVHCFAAQFSADTKTEVRRSPSTDGEAVSLTDAFTLQCHCLPFTSLVRQYQFYTFALTTTVKRPCL